MFLTVDFGPGNAGLGTVGYELRDNLGVVVAARTTAGVLDIGDGLYGVGVDLIPAAIAVKWDTGGGSPIFAGEGLEPGRDIALVRKVIAGRRAVVSLDDMTITFYDDDNMTVVAVFSISADGRLRERTA